MFSKEYQEKVYAGLLGKAIGVRLGAPIESLDWTYENIQKAYGEITGYVKDSKRFAADDDTNGPIFFMRSLIDSGKLDELTAEDVAKAWLNYAREEVGMFWWGGKGISTEHTAYLNLKEGINAPLSGSIQQNGIELAEQVGGQIFIDSWGLLFPGNNQKAADYAEIAASVAHDGNGLYGARFIATCISEAFVEKDILKIVQKGLKQIPSDSDYYHKMQLVIDFYQENKTDFHVCRRYIADNFGYQHYPGACHIIPNAAICMLGLLYGAGDFSRTIEITVMCGWDTDSNAGVVGTILGVMNGIQGIPYKYREDINDILIASSFSGYLNIIDIPTIAKEIAMLGYQVNHLEVPIELQKAYHPGEIYYDFYFSRVKHGFEVSNPFRLLIQDDPEQCLSVLVDNLIIGDEARLYIKPFYHRKDFGDERYQPVFTPTVYSGQKVKSIIELELWEQDQLSITPYIHLSYLNQYIKLEEINLLEEKQTIEFTIPDSKGDLIDELGFYVTTNSEMKDGNGTLGKLYINFFQVSGEMNYEIDFSIQEYEFNGVTPLSYHLVDSKRVNNQLELSFGAILGKSFLGNYYSGNIHLETTVQIKESEEFFLLFRSQGVENSYQIGFSQGIQLFYNDELLAEVDYDWQQNQKYDLKLIVNEDLVELYVDSHREMTFQGIKNRYGLYGYSGKNSKIIIEKCKAKSTIYQKKLAIEVK